jgi:hypothetical protein
LVKRNKIKESGTETQGAARGHWKNGRVTV